MTHSFVAQQKRRDFSTLPKSCAARISFTAFNFCVQAPIDEFITKAVSEPAPNHAHWDSRFLGKPLPIWYTLLELSSMNSLLKDVAMYRRDEVKSWLLGLLCGAMLAAIHFFLFPSLYTRDLLIPLGTLVGAYVIVPAISAWIVSLWTQSWDAGMKAGCITGLSAGIGAFCAALIFVLILSRGQIFDERGYPLAGLLAFLPFCLLGISISLAGTLLGCKIAQVEL